MCKVQEYQPKLPIELAYLCSRHAYWILLAYLNTCLGRADVTFILLLCLVVLLSCHRYSYCAARLASQRPSCSACMPRCCHMQAIMLMPALTCKACNAQLYMSYPTRLADDCDAHYVLGCLLLASKGVCSSAAGEPWQSLLDSIHMHIPLCQAAMRGHTIWPDLVQQKVTAFHAPVLTQQALATGYKGKYCSCSCMQCTKGHL